MLPVQDVLPSRTTPWVTIILVILLALVLIAEAIAPDQVVRSVILSYGLVPAHLSAFAPVTAIFLHYGLIDGLTNLLGLWVFGDNLEDRLGHARFLAFFLLCGAAAWLLTAGLVPGVSMPLVGAGGAVGGVIGAYLVLLPASRVLVVVPTTRGIDLIEVPAMLWLGFWILAGGVFVGGPLGPTGVLPVTLLVQLAGLVSGAAAVRFFRRSERLQCAWWNVPAGQSPPARRRTSRETSANSVSRTSS